MNIEWNQETSFLRFSRITFSEVGNGNISIRLRQKEKRKKKKEKKKKRKKKKEKKKKEKEKNLLYYLSREHRKRNEKKNWW